MGLDMYLEKVKKYDDATLREILETVSYVGYLNNERAKGCSFEEWCGGKEEFVRKDLVDKMKKDLSIQYYAWDTDREYPRERITSDLGYWRKANQIHNWFVTNVQDGEYDCGSYPVSKEQIEELLDACREVLSASELVDGKVCNGYTFENGREVPIMEDGKIILDPSVADELLPTRSGFFFGGTAYDEWYYEDIKHTIEVLEDTLRDIDFEHEIVFYSSSW